MSFKCEECGKEFDLDVDILCADDAHKGTYHLECFDKMLEREKAKNDRG